VKVSRFQDLMGRWIEKAPSFFLRLGRMETSWAADAIAEKQIDRPIYVAGLARSGTTILLELLASRPETAVHQYKDFPLVHIPLWWNKFLERASQKNSAAIERAHKDRIKITPDSPEAMEEILWMAFFSACHDPAKSHVLAGGESHPEFETFYKDHIRKLLLAKGGTRYLSKGNYNISRIEYINHLFPQASFLIPIRDPNSHIASLMKQHRHFSDMETRDPKVLAYMQRAGHFEFGLDRRPINFNNGSAGRIQKLWREGQEIRGWAASWASAYAFISNLYENNATLAKRMKIVPYGTFLKEPFAILQEIYKHCELEIQDEALQKQAARISPPDYYKANFSDSDLNIIHEETCAVADRIQNLISAPI